MDVNEELKFWENSKKKNFFFWGGGGGQGGVGSGGGGVRSGGGGGGWVWGVRVDVNEELKFLGKFTKKFWWGVRWGGGGQAGGGVRVDVNAMLGVGVMWGMGDVNQE